MYEYNRDCFDMPFSKCSTEKNVFQVMFWKEDGRGFYDTSNISCATDEVRYLVYPSQFLEKKKRILNITIEFWR